MDGLIKTSAWIACCIGPLVGSVCGAAAGAEPSSEPRTTAPAAVEEVLDVWREHESAIASFAAEWKESVSRLPDSLLSTAAVRGTAPQGKKSDGSADEVTTSLELSLAVSGNQLEFRSRGRQWMPEFDVFAWREYRAAYQPPLAFRLFHTPGHAIELLGFIQQSAVCPEARSLSNLPLLLALRPLHALFGPIPATGTWVAPPDSASIDGHPCLVIERQECRFATALEQGELRESYWVDPAKEYAVRRYELMQGEFVLVQGNFEYDGAPTWPWVPSRWSLVAYGGNPAAPRERHDGELVEFEATERAELPAPPFEFPVGALVNDEVTETIWLARGKGERRLVTEDEQQRRATYQELLTTESGRAGLSPLSGLSSIFCLVSAACAIGAAFRLRRGRRRAC